MKILQAILAFWFVSYVVTFVLGMVLADRIRKHAAKAPPTPMPSPTPDMATLRKAIFKPTDEDEEAAFLAGECGHTLVRVPDSDYCIAHGRPEQGRC